MVPAELRQAGRVGSSAQVELPIWLALVVVVMMRRAGRVRQRGVVVLGVMLAQQIAAIIVAVGRAHDGMGVVARRPRRCRR